MPAIPFSARSLFASILVAAILLLVLTVWIYPENADDGPDPRLTERRRVHILYGDETGGGHLHGQNKPCKSEFPADWNETEVIMRIRHMAANDNAGWRSGKNGYYVSEQTAKDGTRVRVVLDKERDDIVTAYPVNVRRNPCPSR